MLSTLGKYNILAGQAERGVEMVGRGLRLMEPVNPSSNRVMRQIEYSASLMRASRLEEALDNLPSTTPENGNIFLEEAVARADIYGRLDQLLEARDWQQRAYSVLTPLNYEQLRPEVDALGRLWNAASTR